MIHTFIGMLLFAFFAITGLIVDVGLARLTQRQMSQATDSASLEGARLRDTFGAPSDDVGRRDAARVLLNAHFDDDFHVTAADAGQYGAGPLVTLGPGMTSIGANRQVLVDPNRRVYKPTPQLNVDNARHGDLVQGEFYVSDLEHREDARYVRTDFFEPGAVPPPPVDAPLLDAFLVRLRRTRNAAGLDQQPGISSRGPALPFLFGQGSMIAPEHRARGMTVRATSIAGARRATLVGLPDPTAGLPGATPFLLEYSYWNEIPKGQTLRLRFTGNGLLAGSAGNKNPPGGPPPPNPFFPYDNRGGPPIIPPGQINSRPQPIGMLSFRGHEDYPLDPLAPLRRAWSIGDYAVPIALDWPHDDDDDPTAWNWTKVMEWLGNPHLDGYVEGAVYFYVPIYDGTVEWDGVPGRQPGDDFKTGDPRIVGFGTVAVRRATATGFDNDKKNKKYFEIEIVKLPSYVAPFNASAVETPGLAGALVETIMDRYKKLSEPLRAAALVR